MDRADKVILDMWPFPHEFCITAKEKEGRCLVGGTNTENHAIAVANSHEGGKAYQRTAKGWKEVSLSPK